MTDAKGLPIEGAVVVASDHSDVHATAWTDANGTATLNVRDCLKPVITLRAWTPEGNTIDARTQLPISASLPGDINGDGVVDLTDYRTLGEQLGICPGDIDGDGEVNGADLSFILGYWGACTAP